MLDKEKCKCCTHGDGSGDCITKMESPFGGFVCRHNEEYDGWIDVEEEDEAQEKQC